MPLPDGELGAAVCLVADDAAVDFGDNAFPFRLGYMGIIPFFDVLSGMSQSRVFVRNLPTFPNVRNAESPPLLWYNTSSAIGMGAVR